MTKPRAIMVVPVSEAVYVMEELAEAVSKEEVFIKVVSNSAFSSMFDINTESVVVDIDEKSMFKLMEEAHQKNITFNQHVTEILEYQLEKMEKKDFTFNNKKQMFKPKAETFFTANEDRTLDKLVDELLKKT